MKNMLQKLDLLRQKGAINSIDVELCRFFKKREDAVHPDVLLAACLLSTLYCSGDVCADLNEHAGTLLFEDDGGSIKLFAPELKEWKSTLAKSMIVGSPGDYKPLILDDKGRLYLQKLWNYERILGDKILQKSAGQTTNIDLELLKDGLNRLFGSSTAGDVNWQKVAAANAVQHDFSVISGGPGTGKTTTVVKIIALLLEQAGHNDVELQIGLAAPTGKAAARLKGSITEAKAELEAGSLIVDRIPDAAKTLHQLLGARRHTSSFKYNADNPLPFDVVIIDEASMVDQAMMSKLMQALPKKTKLILLGDKDQLASVEAGSVLGDVCPVDENTFSEQALTGLNKLSLNISDIYLNKTPGELTDNITLLKKNYRFDSDSGIKKLVDATKKGAAQKVIQILQSGEYPDSRLFSIEEPAGVRKLFKDKICEHFKNVVSAADPAEALAAFESFRILAAHRKGPLGTESLNSFIEKILSEENIISKYEQWYPGKPVIINVNDYRLDLFNGDIGVCLPDEEGELQVCFSREDEVRRIAPLRLPAHSLAYALTVHKSQGSEFDEVLFILPNIFSGVLSQELFYTAVSRARKLIFILGQQSILKKTVLKQRLRTSGLRDLLWER